VNREEAKLLLTACRPNGADADDPRLAEAFALLERDAELRAWFEAEQAADKVIAAKLKAAPVPDDLLAQIRAGTQARIAGKPRRPSLALAMAASLALLGLIAALWLNRSSSSAPVGSFAAYRADMAQFLQTFPQLDLATDRLPEVRQWLSQQHSLTQTQFPLGIERFPTIGCRTVEWHGKKLALVCFMVEGEVVHLFVLPRGAFPDATPGPTATFATVGGKTTASWSSGENIFLVITQANEDLLRKIL
jgi:anti-sigma factor RsiW